MRLTHHPLLVKDLKVIRDIQKILYGKWSPGLADKDMFLTDATCYESHLRYPTDIKLLWEGCEWMHGLLMEKSRMMGEPMPRSKYHDVARRVGADTIYANNENRRYCSENNITTSFIRKGPAPRDEQADLRSARRIIGSLRATVMEGSFGNQKQHYNLMRIAARNRHSETLQLFFGIHMANAATLAARQTADEQRKKKRA